jgi:hypothetical protein
MTTFNQMVAGFHELTDEIILQVTALTGPKLLMAFLLALGYLLQAIPWVPNRFIPHVLLSVGTVLSPLFIGVPGTGEMHHALILPDVTAIVQVAMTGFLLAAATWAIHAKLLKPRIDDRISPPTEPPPKP